MLRRLLILLVLLVGAILMAACQPIVGLSTTVYCDRLSVRYTAGGIDQPLCEVAIAGGIPPGMPLPPDICTNPRYVVMVTDSFTGAPAITFDPAAAYMGLPTLPAGPAGTYYQIDVPFIASYPEGTLFDVLIVYLDATGALTNTESLDVACTLAPVPGFEIAPNLLDGRINDHMDKDVAAPVAVYCDGGIINVYTLDAAGNGYLAIQATPGQIAAVGIPEGEGVVLGQHRDIRLYRLPEGGFQVNAGITDPINGYDPNAYTFAFNGCPEDANANRVAGRVNPADAPAAIYCTGGGVDVYRVVDGNGVLAFQVSTPEIEAAGVSADHLLLGQDGDIALYRLNTGALQVNGPGDYVYTWQGCR